MIAAAQPNQSNNRHNTASDPSHTNRHHRFLSVIGQPISIIDTSRQIALDTRHTPAR